MKKATERRGKRCHGQYIYIYIYGRYIDLLILFERLFSSRLDSFCYIAMMQRSPETSRQYANSVCVSCWMTAGLFYLIYYTYKQRRMKRDTKSFEKMPWRKRSTSRIRASWLWLPPLSISRLLVPLALAHTHPARQPGQAARASTRWNALCTGCTVQ